MVTLVCKTKDKLSTFPKFLGSLSESVSRAKKLKELGCEPYYIYDGSEDIHYRSDWINEQIKRKNENGSR